MIGLDVKRVLIRAGRQVPNFLTWLRMLSFWIPSALLCAGVQNSYYTKWALVAFGIIAVTDKLDGWIARKFKIESEFGKKLDPIADKFMSVSVLVTLSFINPILFVPTVIITTRETLIAAFLHGVRKRGEEVDVINSGKVKTVVQVVAIVLSLLRLSFQLNWIWMVFETIAYTVAVILTLTSGCDYLVLYKEVRAERKKID